MSIWRRGPRNHPWRASPSPSRTCSRPTASAPRAGPRSSRATSLPTMRPPGHACPARAPSWSARPTATSLRWARRTRTPRTDPCTIPGISSGGSAAAVAAGEAVWALGTDTGGSVRQPASLCGVVGLKPTYGRISRYGLIAFASSLDTVGTFTRTVRDAASMLQVLAGHDPRDATSLDAPVPDYARELDTSIDGIRVGVVGEAFGEGIEPAVAASVRGAVERLGSLGASVG